MVWFDAHPLDPAHDYLVKHTSHTVPARVDGVRHLVNVATLETEPATSLAMNEIGVVRIATAKPLFFDPYKENRVTGSFILIDRKTNHTAGAGMILARGRRFARRCRGSPGPAGARGGSGRRRSSICRPMTRRRWKWCAGY